MKIYFFFSKPGGVLLPRPQGFVQCKDDNDCKTLETGL
jgi:hypothetical protein